MPSSSDAAVPSGSVEQSRSNSTQAEPHTQSGPGGRRTGRVIGIVAVSVAGLLLAGFGVRQLASSGLPDATHRLTLPETVGDGTYELSKDLSQTERADALGRALSAGSRTPQAVIAQYASVSSEAPSVLALSGAYGQFANPAKIRQSMMDGGARAANATATVVQPEDITPTGSDTTVTCQAVKILSTTAVWTVQPMCAWADGNTVALVTVLTAETPEPTPENVDLGRLAALTVKVRTEARQPIG